MYACTYPCIHGHTHVCMYIPMYACTYPCMHVHTHVYMDIPMYACTYPCMHVHTRVCMYKCSPAQSRSRKCNRSKQKSKKTQRQFSLLWASSQLSIWLVVDSILRPILNFAPRGKLSTPGRLCPQEWTLSRRGEVIPWRWNSLVRPSILINSKECWPLGVNKGVNIPPRGQS
jgi:hypothetical protein